MKLNSKKRRAFRRKFQIEKEIGNVEALKHAKNIIINEFELASKIYHGEDFNKEDVNLITLFILLWGYKENELHFDLNKTIDEQKERVEQIAFFYDKHFLFDYIDTVIRMRKCELDEIEQLLNTPIIELNVIETKMLKMFEVFKNHFLFEEDK